MTEAEIQKAIIKRGKASGYLVIRMNAGMGRGHQHLAPAGTPDLFVVGPNSETLWIEVKTPDGVVSPVQEAMHKDLRARGALVFVARGTEYTVAEMIEKELERE